MWQRRFASYPADAAHLYAAPQDSKLNPAPVELASIPTEYHRSGARALVAGKDDVLLKAPLLGRFGYWRDFLATGLDDDDAARLPRHERTG